MQLHKYLIAMMAFSLVVVVFLAATVSMVDNYADMGITTIIILENESAAFDKIDSINTQAEDIEAGVTGSDVGGEDASTTFLGGAWSAVQIVFGSLGVTRALLQDVGNLFNVPPMIVGFAITAIILTVIFTGIYMVFRSKGE